MIDFVEGRNPALESPGYFVTSSLSGLEAHWRRRLEACATGKSIKGSNGKIPLPLVGQRGFERKVGEPKQLNYFAARRVSSLALALAMTSSLTFFGQGA